ncbi:MAG: disulfide bond formation protein B [Pseudomonadota bacterium]
MLTVYGRILLAATGSGLILLGALGFQYLGGLAPCPMCIWQRWPHALAILIGALAVTVLWRQRRWLALSGAGVMLVSAGLGLFHAGVEQGWWEGPATCSAGDPAALSADALMNQIMEAPLVRCDEIVWEFLALSMAGWNALISLALAGLWGASALWWRMPFAKAE